jgi:hypothetical protein
LPAALHDIASNYIPLQEGNAMFEASSMAERYQKLLEFHITLMQSTSEEANRFESRFFFGGVVAAIAALNYDLAIGELGKPFGKPFDWHNFIGWLALALLVLLFSYIYFRMVAERVTRLEQGYRKLKYKSEVLTSALFYNANSGEVSKVLDASLDEFPFDIKAKAEICVNEKSKETLNCGNLPDKMKNKFEKDARSRSGICFPWSDKTSVEEEGIRWSITCGGKKHIIVKQGSQRDEYGQKQDIFILYDPRYMPESLFLEQSYYLFEHHRERLEKLEGANKIFTKKIFTKKFWRKDFWTKKILLPISVVILVIFVKFVIYQFGAKEQDYIQIFFKGIVDLLGI